MRYLKTYKLFESIDKIAGVWDSNEKFEDGDDFKIKFKVSDIIELAKDKPVEEVDPKSINYDFSGRQEDPTETKQRVMNADLSYPIIVVQNEQGRIFTMLDGTHRLEKALILGLNKIRVKVMSKEELIQFKVDDFDKLIEMIKVPIKVGDTVLGGRFKNKKTVVKKIGKNDKGDITINGKPLLKFRIVKESASYDDLKNNVEDYLAHLKDDGFMTETGNVKVAGKPDRDNFYVRVWSPQRPVDNDGSSESWLSYRYQTAGEFTWSQIEDEVNRFISIASEEWNLDYLYVIKDTVDGSTFMRQQFTLDELFNLPGDFKIKSLMIGLGHDIK